MPTRKNLRDFGEIKKCDVAYQIFGVLKVKGESCVPDTVAYLIKALYFKGADHLASN